jgi:PadR family transcriptional regulator PadR
MDPELKALETEMNRGFVQVLILAALEERRYGYGLSRHLSELGYPIEENTLYPLLRRLEKNGFITSKWDVGEEGAPARKLSFGVHKRPRRFYRITPKGEEFRRRALEIWSRQNSILETVREATRHA